MDPPVNLNGLLVTRQTDNTSTRGGGGVDAQFIVLKCQWQISTTVSDTTTESEQFTGEMPK